MLGKQTIFPSLQSETQNRFNEFVLIRGLSLDPTVHHSEVGESPAISTLQNFGGVHLLLNRKIRIKSQAPNGI